jgi:hypothetical protein
MKFINLTALISFAIFQAGAEELFPIEKFKTLSAAEREIAILNAPVAEREELQRIHIHLSLLSWMHGDFQSKKELSVAQKRGFVQMVNLFNTRANFWSEYIVGFDESLMKSGMSEKERRKREVEYLRQQEEDDNRFEIARNLAFTMAASPAALDLEKECERLRTYWETRLGKLVSSKQHVTKEDLDKINDQVNQIFRKMETLPKLTPEQTRKEYDDFPEILMYSRQYPMR